MFHWPSHCSACVADNGERYRPLSQPSEWPLICTLKLLSTSVGNLILNWVNFRAEEPAVSRKLVQVVESLSKMARLDSGFRLCGSKLIGSNLLAEIKILNHYNRIETSIPAILTTLFVTTSRASQCHPMCFSTLENMRSQCEYYLTIRKLALFLTNRQDMYI